MRAKQSIVRDMLNVPGGFEAAQDPAVHMQAVCQLNCTLIIITNTVKSTCIVTSSQR